MIRWRRQPRNPICCPARGPAIYAWMYLSTTRPWIEALTVNHITERKNNPAIVKGGGFTQRYAHKKVRRS